MNAWHTKKLGDLCGIELGRTPARAHKLFWDENRETTNVWLSIADLLNSEGNIISDSKEYISDEGAAISKIVRKGTLLVSFKLTLGRLAFAGRDLYTNEAIAALTINDEKILAKKFLFYFLHFFDWDKEAEGDEKIKGKTLNKAKLKEISIHYPSLREQQRIVTILDEVFDGIAVAAVNAEKNLASARELFDNYLCTTFCMDGDGWSRTTLGDLCESVEYGTATKSLPEGRVAVLRMGNIQNGNLDWENLVYTDDNEEIVKYSLKAGDVLFNRTNSAEHVGKTAIYRGEQPAIFAGYLIRIHRKEGHLDGEYLNYFLNSPLARDYGKTVMSQSVNQANISGSKLKEYPIAIPSLSRQREIVAKLHRLKAHTSDLAEIYQSKLEELRQLKAAILKKAFAGELTAQPERLLQEAVV
jgi:type I restriction enzyme S subunit